VQAQPLPAAADGGAFTIRSTAPNAEEQYFETVPQGLNSADSAKGPRLGSLIEGPKGKQVQQVGGVCLKTLPSL
jgi:hypothetical protein